jgi:hypothetical protein
MVLASAGCGGWRSAQEDNIMEAVFRYQLDLYTGPSAPVVFFLSVVGHRLVVKKLSECMFANRVKDIETGADGVILYIDEIKWINRREVEVDARWYVGPLSARGELYHVAYEGRRWIVKSRTHKWIS